MVAWGSPRGVVVEPYGVDLDPDLVARAVALHPQWEDRFWTGDAVSWSPPDGRRFDLVHLLLDVVPADRHAALVAHWREHVTPGGRLVVSNYDPRPEQSAEHLLLAAGHRADGRTSTPRRRQTGAAYHSGSAWIDC